MVHRKCTSRSVSGSTHRSSASRYGSLTRRCRQSEAGSHGSPIETVSPTSSAWQLWKYATIATNSTARSVLNGVTRTNSGPAPRSAGYAEAPLLTCNHSPPRDSGSTRSTRRSGLNSASAPGPPGWGVRDRRGAGGQGPPRAAGADDERGAVADLLPVRLGRATPVVAGDGRSGRGAGRHLPLTHRDRGVPVADRYLLCD